MQRPFNKVPSWLPGIDMSWDAGKKRLTLRGQYIKAGTTK